MESEALEKWLWNLYNWKHELVLLWIRSFLDVPSRPIFYHYDHFIRLHDTAQETSSSPKLLGERENLACFLCSLSHCIYTFLALRPSTQSYRPTTRIICGWIRCWVCCQSCLLSKPEQTPGAHRSRVYLAVTHISSRTLPRWAASV